MTNKRVDHAIAMITKPNAIFNEVTLSVEESIESLIRFTQSDSQKLHSVHKLNAAMSEFLHSLERLATGFLDPAIITPQSLDEVLNYIQIQFNSKWRFRNRRRQKKLSEGRFATFGRLIKIIKDFRRLVKNWVILTVHNFGQKDVSLPVCWTKAESLRLWWVVGDCSMLVVQHVQRPGFRTMLLFAGWWDRRRQMIASGASVPIVQPGCRVPSNSLVHSRGEICMWVDITWTSPFTGRVASVASLSCDLWWDRIFQSRCGWVVVQWIDSPVYNSSFQSG